MAAADVVRLLFRVPVRLHARLSKEAAQRGISLTAHMVARLEGTSSSAVVDAGLEKKLKAAARESGRSVMEEVEFRLGQSFEKQSLLREVLTLAYGPTTAMFLAEADKFGILKLRDADKEFMLQRFKEYLDSRGLPGNRENSDAVVADHDRDRSAVGDRA